jgi:hypothetical protein
MPPLILATLRRLQSDHVLSAIGLSATIAASTAAMALVSSRETVPREPRPLVPVADAPPPTAPPLLVRDIAPQEAEELNRAIPFVPEASAPAKPFKMAGDRASLNRAVECLATAIYYEAGNEPLKGQRAVAQVVLNRVRHPAFVPSVCAVVYQGSERRTGCQFSFTCDGSLLRKPSIAGWTKARAIAAAALAGSVFAPVGYSTHYHADYVVPYWATSLAKTKVVGRHIFYRWPQWWGTAAAFTRRPADAELDPRLLRSMALARYRNNEGIQAGGSSQGAAEPDPRLELIRTIQFIAAGSPRDVPSNSHEQEVRRHFSRYSKLLAVQIYRQLSASESPSTSNAFLELVMHHSGPPELTAVDEPSPELIRAVGGPQKAMDFIASLRDFAKQPDFESFLKKRSTKGPALASDGLAPEICDRSSKLACQHQTERISY